MTSPADAAEAGALIASACEEARVPYALGGALALGVHGVPRGTLDVDVNVFVRDEALPSVIALLIGLGIEIDPPAALARAARDGMFVGRWHGIRIDVFLPSIPFSEEAGRTRVQVSDDAGLTYWFLSAEAITVFKLLFFRPKDIVDLQRLVAVSDALDHGYVRRWMVDMMGDDDPRVRAWDDLVARFARGSGAVDP